MCHTLPNIWYQKEKQPLERSISGSLVKLAFQPFLASSNSVSI